MLARENRAPSKSHFRKEEYQLGANCVCARPGLLAVYRLGPLWARIKNIASKIIKNPVASVSIFIRIYCNITVWHNINKARRVTVIQPIRSPGVTGNLA
jgi:hypothetical protein